MYRFLHNALAFILNHDEGMKKGTADTAAIEAKPIVQLALAAAEAAAKQTLQVHLGKVLGVEPTAEGVANGIIEKSHLLSGGNAQIATFFLGNLLEGSGILAPDAPAVGK